MTRTATEGKCNRQIVRDDGGSALAGRCLVSYDFGGGKGAWGQAAALHSCGRALNAPTALRCSVLRPRRGTRCVRFALYVQTAATRIMTTRASRLAASPGLAGRSGPVALPLARHKQSTGLFVSRARLLAATEARCGLSPRAFADAFLVCGATNTKDTASRQALAGGGDLWGAEERRPVGAFSARPPQCEPPSGTACRDAGANASTLPKITDPHAPTTTPQANGPGCGELHITRGAVRT